MNRKLLSVILLLIWKVCCDYFYIKTYTSFQYYGIKYDFNNYNKLLESYFFLFIISIIYISTKFRNCNLLLLILIIFQYIPITTYYSFANEDVLFFRTLSIIYVSIFLVNKYIFRIIKYKKIFDINYKKLSFFLLFGLIILIFTNGLPNASSFSFLNVYTRREKFNSNSILEYINSFNLYVITPILIIFSINTKNYKYLLIAILYNSYYFLVSGGKYAFFILALMPVFYKLAQLESFKAIRLITVTLIVSLIVSSFFSSNYGFDFIFNEFYFRTFIVPAWLSFVYVHLFSPVNFYYFSESFSILGKKPYISSPEYVGEYLFADQGGSFASNGLWGDAFANFGYIGLLIIFLVFIFFIVFTNSISLKTNNKLLAAFLAINGFSLINTSLLSALASRGLIIGVVIFMFINQYERKT